MKTIVLDTNVLLHDPNSIYHFGPNEIVIPAIVIEELDSKKREPNEIGRNARFLTRFITSLRKGNEGKLSFGVPLKNGGKLRIELNHVSFKKLQSVFGERTNDNRIIAVAINLQNEFEDSLDIHVKNKLEELKKAFKEEKGMKKEEYLEKYETLTGRSFTLVSNDGLVIVKADAIGIAVEMYENDRVKNIDAIHKGFHELLVPKEMIDEFYEKEEIQLKEFMPYLLEQFDLKDETNLYKVIHAQDFFILRDIYGSKSSAVARLLFKENRHSLVTLVINDEKTGNSFWGIKPRNVQQVMLSELLLDPHVPLIVGIGQAGTGKTLLALAAGLSQTEGNQPTYKKTLIARPVVPMGKDIGFLPGEMADKLRPWMQPIYDNLEFLLRKQEGEKENDKNQGELNVDIAASKLKLEIEALTYIRGRSIPNQFIIIDEAQNLSPHEVKTILTRVGEGSKVVLLGDPEQIDHPYLDATNNGLTYVAERMKGEKDVGIVNLQKTERSDLADRAAKLL